MYDFMDSGAWQTVYNPNSVGCVFIQSNSFEKIPTERMRSVFQRTSQCISKLCDEKCNVRSLGSEEFTKKKKKKKKKKTIIKELGK